MRSRSDVLNSRLKYLFPPLFLPVCYPCNDAPIQQEQDMMLTGWRDGQIRSHDADTGTLLWSIDNAHAGGVTSLALSHNQRFLVTGGREGELRVWELRSRELVRVEDDGHCEYGVWNKTGDGQSRGMHEIKEERGSGGVRVDSFEHDSSSTTAVVREVNSRLTGPGNHVFLSVFLSSR